MSETVEFKKMRANDSYIRDCTALVFLRKDCLSPFNESKCPFLIFLVAGQPVSTIAREETVDYWVVVDEPDAPILSANSMIGRKVEDIGMRW